MYYRPANVQLYLFLKKNISFFFGGFSGAFIGIRFSLKPRAYHFEFDRDVQELGIANNDPKLLDVCVEKLLKKQDVTRAQRILERYTTQKFEHPKDWKKWLDKNRDRLFFSDTGGYKFHIKQ